MPSLDLQKVTASIGGEGGWQHISLVALQFSCQVTKGPESQRTLEWKVKNGKTHIQESLENVSGQTGERLKEVPKGLSCFLFVLFW